MTLDQTLDFLTKLNTVLYPNLNCPGVVLSIMSDGSGYIARDKSELFRQYHSFNDLTELEDLINKVM